MSDKELGIRKLLWLTHSCGQSQLYSDDGEMQCHSCGLDFARHSEKRIEDTFEKIGVLKYALQSKCMAQDEVDNSMIGIRLNNLMSGD